MEKFDDSAGTVPGQEDFDAIMRATLDYVEGWYDADAERMQRSLHPKLVKRTITPGPESDRWQLWRTTTAESLVGYTREGGGSDVPEPERVYQVTILDIFRHMATVKCISPWYVDYLHLARVDEQGWLIVNVLWEVREGAYIPKA